MEFMNEQGQISAARALSLIGARQPKQICNFDFESAEDAEALLAYFYRKEMGHDELDADVLAAYIHDVIDWMMNGDRPLLLLMGQTGCGKTTMLNAICKMVGYLYYSNISGTGTSLDRRGFQWDSAYKVAEWAKNDRNRYVEFQRCEWAAIDDLGQENKGELDYGSPIYPIRDVLLYRYENKLLTIASTNFRPKDLTEFYGERVGDRLAEMAHIIKFNETSYRRL